MKARSAGLIDDYQCAMKDYLAGRGEAALERAHELGRQALAEGIGVLEMAALQHEALVRLLEETYPSLDCAQTVKRAEAFAVESLSTFEMTHRGFRESNITLRRLNEKLSEKLEEGAKQVAHVLHNEAGQLLAAVMMALDRAARELPSPAAERMGEIRALLEEMQGQLRRLSHELWPTILDDLGVDPALRFLAEGTSERTGIPVAVEGTIQGRLPTLVETALYRTVQEALTNMAKHARASRAEVRVERGDRKITCSVWDDGVGFDVSGVLNKRGDRGLGLIGMMERLASLGGTLEINSAPAQGTELRITVPLEA